jgi:hypothetical protein
MTHPLEGAALNLAKNFVQCVFGNPLHGIRLPVDSLVVVEEIWAKDNVN